MSRCATESNVWEVSPCREPAPPAAPRRGLPLDIVVSDALARYWILDCPPGLASARELDLYAADRFAALFGDEPADWILRVNPDPHVRRWLACALPARTVAAACEGAAAQGWRPRSVQPRFVREFNCHCRALRHDAAFCVAEPEGTTLGLIVANEWRGVRAHPPLDRCAVDFATLLRRDCRQMDIDAGALRPHIVGMLQERAR